MAVKKASAQLLVTQYTKDALMSLAFIGGESQAEVSRRALERALPALLAERPRELSRLAAVATAWGVSPGRLAEAAKVDRLDLEDLEVLVGRGQKSYPTFEEIEDYRAESARV